MNERFFGWLGRDFIEISAEGRAGLQADGATIALFQRLETELQSHGWSLDDVVRVRVWDGTKTRALWRLQRGRRFSPEIAKRQAPALFRSSGSIRMQLSVWSCWR